MAFVRQGSEGDGVQKKKTNADTHKSRDCDNCKQKNRMQTDNKERDAGATSEESLQVGARLASPVAPAWMYTIKAKAAAAPASQRRPLPINIIWPKALAQLVAAKRR